MATNESKVDEELVEYIKRLLSDKPVAYHPVVANAVGSVTAAIFLSQLMYWAPRNQDPDGWIYKTRDEIYQETALTRYEQEGARKALLRAGVIEEKLRKVPAKLHFRIIWQELARRLRDSQFPSAGQTAPDGSVLKAGGSGQSGRSTRLTALAAEVTNKPGENSPTSWGNFPQLAGGEVPSLPGEKPPTISENTSESTPKSTTSSEFRTGSHPKDNTRQNPATQRALPELPAATEGKRSRPRLSLPTGSSSVAPDGPPPSYIDHVMADVVEKLTGGDHELPSHRTQARTLWESANLSVQDFVALLYELRDEVRRRRGIDEPMAYFFTCIKVRLGLLANPNPPGARAAPAARPVEPAGSLHTSSASENATDIYVRLPEGTSAARLWHQALARLREQVTRPMYETYLRETEGVGVDEDGQLVVSAPSEFVVDWLESKFSPRIHQTLEALEGVAVSVAFVVATSASDPPQTMPSEPLSGPRTPPNPSRGPNG